MNDSLIFFALLLFTIVLIVVFFALKKLIEKKGGQEEMEDMVNKVFGMSANQIAQQSREILKSEKDSIKVDLANKQQVIEKLVKELKQDLNTKQDELRLVEKDRVKKFGELTSSLEEHRHLADQLRVSTQQLASVLSNNQARGGWGERIIEDLLRSNGLIEGTHYLRQSQQGTSSARPDITLLLPNDRNVPVDVKFPYQEVQKMSIAETKSAKASHLKQFAQDIKRKIDKVATYIDPEQNTLDYAILFVPNEMIFSFINQKLPNLVDLAMSKRVIIVSPFTFIIVARTVMESYRNFMISDKLRDVVKHIDEFVGEWGKFKNEFDKFGRSISTLQKGYETLTTTRAKQMDRRIERVENMRSGALIEKVD